MRKLLSIFSVALVAMFAIGCEIERGPGNNDAKFSLTEQAVTSTSIEVSINPAKADANYFAGIVTSDEIVGKDDATIIAEYIQKLAMYKGMQFITATNLTPDTDYVAIAFYMGDIDKVAKLSTRTEAAGATEGEFSIKIDITNITADSAMATATASNEETEFFFRVITTLELREFGIYGNDLETLKWCLENPSRNDYIKAGSRTLDCKGLAPKFEYYAVAFNIETVEDMLADPSKVQIFTKAFTTEDAPEVDPNTLFIYENLTTDYTGFTLDVSPVKGDDALWTYYIFEKRYYNEYLAKSRHNVVMRAYFGLYNLRGEYNILNHAELTFNDFVTKEEYMGCYGSKQINSYDKLLPNTEYVVAMFYMDPKAEDPSIVYDYNYVAVEFKTKTPDSNAKVTMEVTDPIITKDGLNYTYTFNIKVSDNAVSLQYGATAWTDLVASYYDPNDCESIRAFVRWAPLDEEKLALAKSDEGITVAYTNDIGEFDGVVMFEAENSQAARTQYMVRITPGMFE